MELAHPAGAESLAPQPSQLVSAVASTKKSLLANFAHTRWPSPAESKCHLGCQKDQKKCSRPCATGASYWPSGWRAERQDDDGSRRTANDRILVRPPSIGGGICPLHRKCQTSVYARKSGFHFGKTQVMDVAGY